MIFSSYDFFIFFILYLLISKAVPSRWLNWFVIVASMFFYGYWKPVYLFLPVALVYLGFYLTRWTYAETEIKSRSTKLKWSIVFLLLPLIFFKYSTFIYNELLSKALAPLGAPSELPFKVALPLGISFVTFTIISYLVDVSRRKIAIEPSPVPLWVSIIYFPHLIAGPIVRPAYLIPQFAKDFRQSLSRSKVKIGLLIFSVGLFKKVVIADQVSTMVNAAYGSLGSGNLISAPEAVFAILGFTVQIYCDFSGYTDMALGISSIIGIHLPQNFKQPYASASIIEFWRRWHMTLSFWLRDYLYIPLGGNAQGNQILKLRNLFITMLLGGLWHGANWTFIVWGMLHGAALCLAHSLKTQFSGLRTPKWLGVSTTFVFVSIAWIYFRAPNIISANLITKSLLLGTWTNSSKFIELNVFPIALITFALIVHKFDDHARFRLFWRKSPRQLTYFVIATLWIVSMGLSIGHSADFIYFDF